MTSRLVASSALTNLTRRIGRLTLIKTTTTRAPSASSIAYSHSKNISLPTAIPSSTTTTKLVGTAIATSPSTSSTWTTTSLNNFLNGPFLQVNRTFATRKKRLERRRKRKLAAKAAERAEAARVAGGGGDGEKLEAAPQHEAWVDFQKSISVGDFQTGQVTKARVQQKGESGQKLRDLKRREKLEMRMAKKGPDLADVRGGEYPVGRYSDEETERLLAMAYAAIPERAGKRGTRNLKRQKRRWFLVRKIHAKAKRQRILAHYRKMEKRSQKMKELRAVKEGAADARAQDREYQKEVLRRWIDNLKRHDSDGFQEREVIQAEATVNEQAAKA